MIAHTIEEHTDSLAAYMPNGRLFEAKNINNSNFRKLLRGIAGEIFTAEGYLKTLGNEYFPDTTTLFIDEWESALGIPDDCLPVASNIIDRRRNILAKLVSLGVQTANDFVNMGALFGITISVNSGSKFSVFPLTFPILMFTDSADARYTIVVDFPDEALDIFPMIFPFKLGDPSLELLECLFNKLKPDNCDVIFRQV